MDTLSPERRSALMAKVKGRDTNPERLVRRLVWSLGYRYRLHSPRLPGKPDMAFASKRRLFSFMAVFGIGMIVVAGSHFLRRG